MNVLLVNSTCKIGGVSTFMLSMRQALEAAGHQCELFFFEHGSMDAHLPAGCPAHFGTLADCLQFISRHHIDVVHANNVDWTTGISAVRALGARLIVTAHKVREGGWTYGWNRTNCDAFASVAAWIGRELQPHTDLPIQVVHNGVDTARFAPEPVLPRDAIRQVPIVAWVGRGSAPRKRLERFAAAAPALHAAGLRVWIVDQHGPERFAETWPTEARLLGRIAERWHGIPHEQMPDLYREIAASGGCIVSTADMEGLPLTLLEAQACGVPVIAAKAFGVDECVRAEHGGVLVDVEREDLASRVVETLEDASVASTCGTQAAEFVAAEFSLTRMCRRYLDLYAGSTPATRTPLLSASRWSRYRDQRLGVAYRQFAAAQSLADAGDWSLSAAAARSALATAPTMFARPSRLTELARIAYRGRRPTRSLSMRHPLLNWLEITPREKTPKPCGSDDVLDGRKPCQMGWYGFIAEVFEGEEVLDVGCGSGEGLKVIAGRASRAVGIDLDERLQRPDLDVQIMSITDLPDKSFDNVVCLDVIEHVVEDRAFVAQLFRVARKAVFVTTPNYTISRNRHPYHVREYTPGEFARLFEPYGNVTLFGGSSRGQERATITRRGRYFFVNGLYTWKPTQLAAKIAKRLLGVTIWKHNAALVRLPQSGRERAPRPAVAA